MTYRDCKQSLRRFRGFLYRVLPGYSWPKKLEGFERRWGLETRGFPKEGFYRLFHAHFLRREKPGWFMELRAGDGVIGSLGSWMEKAGEPTSVAAWEDRPHPLRVFRENRPRTLLFEERFRGATPEYVKRHLAGLTTRGTREASAVCRAIRQGSFSPRVLGIWNPSRRRIWFRRLQRAGFHLEAVYHRMEIYRKKKSWIHAAGEKVSDGATLVYEKVRNKGSWRRLPERLGIRKTLFIHIPKNAGTSVSSALYGLEVGHHPFQWYAERFPFTLRQVVTFAIIRNPRERFLSAFWYLKGGGNTPEDARFAEEYLKPFPEPVSFSQACVQSQGFFQRIKERHHHFKTQYEFVTWRNRLAVDFLIDFDRLPTDLLQVPGAGNWIHDLQVKNARKERSPRPENFEFENHMRALYPEDYKLWHSVTRSEA